MSQKGFGRRVNAWLAEPKGEIFRDGKWRFWFVALIAFSVLNAALTAMVFDAGGVLQTYMGTVLVGVGALLAWLGVGAVHYSDSHDPHLSRGVGVLDSMTLLFVVAHFSFLMWVYGHLSTLKNAEAEYAAAVEKHNAKVKAVQDSNARIADALRDAAKSQESRAKIEAGAAYQLRKAAERGARVKAERGGITANVSMAPVELAKPSVAPADSSSAYLTRWDSAVRLANFGELALAIITLIFIRVRSSLTNSPREEENSDRSEFPDSLEVENRLPIKREKFAQKKETAKDHGPSTFAGLRIFRQALKDISFRLAGFSFKSKVKGDAVWTLMVRANKGTQETVASAKAKLSLLDDAVRMPREAFRERLEKFLRENEFEI